MDSKELRGLCESYVAVYDEDLRNELQEMSDEFFGIENLTDEEIDAIVEETIFEMLDEGYDFDELEEVFDEFISEATVTVGGKTAGKGAKVTTGSGSRMAAASRLSNIKAKKRAENINKIKTAVKSGVAKAKEAGKEAKFRAVDKPVATYATKRNLHPAAGMAARSKDPEKRRGLRAKVAADIKGRIKKKIAQAQVGAYGAAMKAGQAASDVAGKAKQSAKNLAAKTKRGAKSIVGKTARALASGASKVASRLGEEIDIYDVVLEYLIDEGYANTVESAESIMVNMSEDWRNKIIEASYSAKSARSGKDIGKPGKQFEKIAKEAGERYGSKERGEKVAGAVLAKLRAKRG